MHTAEPSFTLAALVRELALAWQRMSMYQDGHPARRQVVDRAMKILAGLVAPTGSVAIGIRRDALIGTDETIDGGMAQRLAEALYDRNVAILRFDEGIDAREIEAFLRVLPRTRAVDSETPLWEALEAEGVEHVRMEPIDFSEVVATDDMTPGDPAEVGGSDLWGEILRRLLEGDRFGGHELAAGIEGGEIGAAEIRELLERVLRRHGIDPDGDLSVSGAGESGTVPDVVSALSSLLGEVAGQRMIGSRTATDRSAAARHVAELLGAVPESMRDSVLDAALSGMVRDENLDGGAVEALSGSLSAAELVSSLRRLRQERVPFSSRIVGLLDALVLEAAPRLVESDEEADPEAMLEGMRALFRDDDVDRVVPSQGRMDRLAVELRRVPVLRADAEEMDPKLQTLEEHRQLLQLAQTLLDMLQRPIFREEQLISIADRVAQVVQALLASGRVTNAVRLVRGLAVLSADAGRGTEVRSAATRCLDRTRNAETIGALVESLGRVGEGAVDVVRQLIEVLGRDVTRELLLALCEETDLARRRHTFDLLVALGSEVTPYALDLLDDDRWYVRRNMLSLLRRIGDPIPFDRIRSSLAHSDDRVRLEAVKGLGSIPGGPPAELLERLLDDEDPKIAESTATAIGTVGIEAGRDPLVGLLQRADPLARRTSLRVRALQSLSQIGDPVALESLGHFFRGWFAVVSPEERKAAFASLQGYPAEVRLEYARKGLRAPDADVRSICQKLLEEGDGT